MLFGWKEADALSRFLFFDTQLKNYKNSLFSLIQL